MEAIILAGGMGTRLTERIKDMPKVMAPVNGVPFLDYVLNMLIRYGVRHFIFAVGYKAPAILDYYGSSYKGVPIDYAFEDTPLGTGGAIKNAMALCAQPRAVVVNGDTLCDVNLSAMLACHLEAGRPVTLCAKQMRDFDRYGSLEIKNGRVKSFNEKKPTGCGKINSGVYIVEKSLFDAIHETVFSFEKAVLENENIHITAFETDGYFIDIGIPEDYDKAIEQLDSFITAKAVFIDRDGTLNREVNYLSNSGDFSFIYGAPQAVEKLHQMGYLVIVVTNQAGIAKGYYNECAVNKLHGYIDKLLEEENTYIDAYYYCPHHPGGSVPQYAVECECRKPKTGMIDKAVSDFKAKGIQINLERSVMVGDTENDILTGKNASIGKCVLVRTGHPADEGSTSADAVIDSIAGLPDILE